MRKESNVLSFDLLHVGVPVLPEVNFMLPFGIILLQNSLHTLIKPLNETFPMFVSRFDYLFVVHGIWQVDLATHFVSFR